MGKHSKPSPLKDRFKELKEFVSQQSEETVKKSGKLSVRKKGAAVSTRKEKRKAERKMVKMRKNAFKQGKELPTLESVQKEKRKQEEEERQKVKAEKQKIKNRAKRKKKKLRKQQKAEEEKRALAEANKVDDREIKMCEKLLRLNKRKSKTISQGFKNDGLDFLLEAVDPEYLQAMYERGDNLEGSDTSGGTDPDSVESYQSDTGEYTWSEEEQTSPSEEDFNESSEENEGESSLQQPVRGILKHAVTSDSNDSANEEETINVKCEKVRDTKKRIRFVEDQVEGGEGVKGEVSEGKEGKLQGVKQKRGIVDDTEGMEETTKSKRLKKDKVPGRQAEVDSENAWQSGDLCIKGEKQKHVDKDVSGVKLRAKKSKGSSQSKDCSDACGKGKVIGNSKSDKHKDMLDEKTKHESKNNKMKYPAVMEIPGDSNEDSDVPGHETSASLGTCVLEKAKSPKEPVDDSLDYLYGVEDSISDYVDSSDFPSNALENSMALSSEGEPEEEEVTDLDDVAMETDPISDIEESDLAEDDLESGPEFREDIYGRLRDKEGKVVEKISAQRGEGTYVPPAKRLEGLSDKRKAEVERIRKQLKGLLNRVSESNMQSIANQIEELFRTHSRAETSEALSDLIMGACIASYMVPERLIMEQCMLLSVLHHNIGSEVGGTFLQSVARQFKEYYGNRGEGKEIHNVVTVLANLYNFKVVHSLLIFDILKKFTERFGESDIEVILVILKAVGFTLRKEDPVSLKEFIVSIQSVAASVNTDQCTDKSRVQFMLDVILHIKNNNMRKIPNYDPSHLDHLRKLIRQHIRGGCYGDSQLRISLADLLEAEHRGKWWLVGSAWSGRSESHQAKPTETGAGQSVVVPAVSQKLLELANKQRMNTEVRRNIFCVIMTSEDFVDCFEKLLRLGLKHQQEREIIHVIVDLCLQEKAFNPFYAFLSQKFCEYHRRFQMTLQFLLWDKFKELSSMSKVKVDHLCRLLTHLLATGALSLSVFKVLEFAELDKYKMILIKSTLTSLLVDYDLEVTQRAFLRVAPLTKLESLREGLSVFMKHFMCRKKHKDTLSEESEKSLKLLKERVDLADKCLNTKHQVKM